MTCKKVSILLLALCLLLSSADCQKKLKQLMQEQLKSEKINQEKIDKEQKERQERFEAKYRPGYYVGRILPEFLEYRELNQNNWLTPNEAEEVCDGDLQCGGFTFRGSLGGLDLPTRVYFVHYFAEKMLDRDQEYSVNWVSYRTKKPYVVFKGQPLLDRDPVTVADDDARAKAAKFRKSKLDPARMSRLEWPVNDTAALVFSKRPDDDDVRILEKFVFAEQNFNDEEHLTVVNTRAPFAHVNVHDDRPMDLDQCCPEVKNPLNIDWFYDEELDETIETVACDGIDRKEFEEKFVRRRRPAKIVGCFDRSNKLSEFSTEQLVERLKKSGTVFEAKRLVVEGQRTEVENNIEKAASSLANGDSLQLEAPLPDDLADLVNLDKAPIPEDILVKAGKAKAKPRIRVQSASLGGLLTVEPDHHSSVSTLVQGSRWWVIMPADSFPHFLCMASCSHETSVRESLLAPRVWFSHMFSQVIRRPIYGRKPVQTLQKPGEIVFVPSNAPFAFYNVDKTVDVATSFFGVGDVELLTWIDGLKRHYTDVRDGAVGADDKRRMEGLKMQVKTSLDKFKRKDLDFNSILAGTA